jgi:hypothetical protein
MQRLRRHDSSWSRNEGFPESTCIPFSIQRVMCSADNHDVKPFMRDIAVSRTEQDGLVTLAFRFKSITQILDEEDSTPLPDKELTEIAEETLAGYLDEYKVKKDLYLVLALPEKELPPDARTIIPETIRRHFSFHSSDIIHDLVISRREGLYSLAIAIGNALITISFLYFIESNQFSFESFPVILIGGFLTILNWVTIWDTYEHFVYDYRNLWRKKRIYEKISRIPITVEGY